MKFVTLVNFAAFVLLQVYYAQGYNPVAALWNLAGRSLETVESSREIPTKYSTTDKSHSTQESSNHFNIQDSVHDLPKPAKPFELPITFDLQKPAKPHHPILEKPELPILEKPELPILEKPHHPIFEKPHHPIIEKPELPILEKPHHLIFEKPHHPIIEKPHHPIIEKPELPLIEKPHHTIIEKPHHPIIEKPHHPIIEKPELPLIEKPHHTIIEKPHHPTIAKPELPIIEKPHHTIIEKPELPIIEKPHHTIIEKPELPIIEKPHHPSYHHIPAKPSVHHISSKPHETPTPSSNQLHIYAESHSNKTKVFAQTSHGIFYPSLTASQAIGTRGHVLLQDSFLLEKLQSFNRERIVERVVHAKGAGAFGYFKVTHDISHLTKAAFLSTIGKKTKVAVRFSTVTGESGSADTLVNPKGFATKFYTEDGIYDLVGNNFQVFQVRDPMLFVDLNRSRKRNPQTHLQDSTASWDFNSLRPETLLHTLLQYSDIGAPRSYRCMNGAGVHTFKMVNATNCPVYVKFHWTSNEKSKKYFTPEESVEMAGRNPDFLLEDLFDSIARKEYPSWTLSIQVMTFEQAEKHPQNPFDVTKFWRVDEYPMITVGKMILNENPIDYFTQVEQLAFSPSHMVPGIEPSPDRMLHARMFAYSDAQLYRLGSNFAQIPVNRCPFEANTYHRDGLMNVGSNGAGSPNYFPNSFNGLHSLGESGKQLIFHVSGDVHRMDSGNDDNFSLAKFYLSNLVEEDEKLRIMKNLANSLRKADRVVQGNYLKNVAYKVSEEFGNCIKNELGIRV